MISGLDYSVWRGVNRGTRAVGTARPISPNSVYTKAPRTSALSATTSFINRKHHRKFRRHFHRGGIHEQTLHPQFSWTKFRNLVPRKPSLPVGRVVEERARKTQSSPVARHPPIRRARKTLCIRSTYKGIVIFSKVPKFSCVTYNLTGVAGLFKHFYICLNFQWYFNMLIDMGISLLKIKTQNKIVLMLKRLSMCVTQLIGDRDMKSQGHAVGRSPLIIFLVNTVIWSPPSFSRLF